ncbi:MAG: hypothetical protein QOI74_1800, partial [Micromonosporaceae bacterium]|nr:hypothetical protein [Micromonosporaceae bacterium]
QSVLLAVGGLLLAGAAVVLAVFGFGSLGAIGRVGLLTLATMILLILPMALTRRGLNATAETVASVGLLMVLLDGYVTWSLNLFAAESIPTTVYFGLVCLATAVIATAYRGASHLIAPRYATILVLQPVIPLLGYVWLDEPAAWALALTGVATMDLALGISLTRPGRFAALAGFVRPVRLPVHLPSVHLPSVHLPGRHPHPTPPDPPQPPDELLLRPESRPEEPDDVKTATGYPIAAEPIEIIAPRAEHPTAHPSPVLHPALQAPAILRDLTWVLFTLAFGAALSYATVGLATTNTLTPTVRAAMVLILTVTVGMAGALSWRRYPLPDLAGGLATLAVMASITRVGSTALPGHTLLFAALAVAVAAVVVPMMPAPARLGPRLANAGAAAVTAVLLLWRAVPAINGPVRAARPWWHADLPGYADRIGATAGPAGWQLVAAGALLTLAVAIALPGWIRIDATLTGGVLTMLTVPAVLHLNWATTPAVLAIVAIAIGATGLLARTERTAASFVLAAGALGGYAALTSLTRPAATALTLSAITLGGFVIASLRPPRTDPGVELAGRLVGDWASGGAAFALPGAVCSGLAALVAEQVVPGAGAPFVLAGGFVAVSGTLGYATIRLISARHPNQPLLVGTSLGAVAVAVAAVVARGSTIVDMTVGLLLLSSAVLLWLAPSMSSRVIFGQRLTGPDVAAAAVTASTTAAMARVLSLLVPGIGLVTTAVLVLAVAVAVRALPAEQRRGPVVGGLVVGAVVATAAGAAALGGAAGVVRASSPWWHAALGPAWTHTVVQYAPYGWQGPITLLLVAAAAAIVVPEPLGDHLAAIAIGLAAIGAAAGFGLAWWSPMVIGMLAAIGLGMAAAATDQPRVAYTRIAVAGAVGAFAAVASLVRPASTASTLESLAIAAVLIAAFAGVRLAAARTAASRVLVAHLVPVGGGSSAAAVLALAGAAAALAAGERHPASVVMAGALAATSLGLAVAGLACWRTPAFLPYVTAGVALSSSVIALAALPVGLPVGVYGATGALLGVLAELMRVNAARRIGWRPEDGWQPVGNWNPRRTAE